MEANTRPLFSEGPRLSSLDVSWAQKLLSHFTKQKMSQSPEIKV